MRPRLLAPSLRTRVAVAFVLVTAVLTGGLAVGSYVVVRGVLLSDSLDRAEREARFGLELAADLPPRADLRQFVDAFARRGVEAMLIGGGRRVASDPEVAPAVPSSLRRVVAEGHVGSIRLEVASSPYLMIGGRPAGTPLELYLLLPEAGLFRDLSVLRAVLVAGWVVALAAAALVGSFVAARTLAPVGRASRAARSLAEGHLDTRLPIAGDDEFGVLAASFNEMADALEERIRDLRDAGERERRFTGDVAHELRTPVTALVGETALLTERLEELPAEHRRIASMLAGDVARLRRLVDDLIEISRLDAGVDVRREPVDLGGLVEAIARSRSSTDTVDVPPTPIVVETDPRRIERIVGNLIDNAIRHGGGRAEVLIAVADGEVAVRVADRGPGVPTDARARVFERFFKADRSRGGSGAGLGLAIANEHARALGARLEVGDREGGGAVFTLRLPVTEPLRRGDAAVATAHEGEDEIPDQGGGS
jgi:two-component system, OmpR family, sensor histidine kinase MtrB